MVENVVRTLFEGIMRAPEQRLFKRWVNEISKEQLQWYGDVTTLWSDGIRVLGGKIGLEIESLHVPCVPSVHIANELCLRTELVSDSPLRISVFGNGDIDYSWGSIDSRDLNDSEAEALSTLITVHHEHFKARGRSAKADDVVVAALLREICVPMLIARWAVFLIRKAHPVHGAANFAQDILGDADHRAKIMVAVRPSDGHFVLLGLQVVSCELGRALQRGTAFDVDEVFAVLGAHPWRFGHTLPTE